LYDWMTGLDFVTTLARLHGMTRDEARERALHVLEFVGLTDVCNKEIGKYSKGMRQRVKIAHALVNDPDLIVLDEPLQGCDPLARTTIMNVVRELGAMGKTVLVTSHILSEIERITEQIVILHNGRLLALGNLHAIRELLDHVPHRILLRTDNARTLGRHFLPHPDVYGVRFPDEGELIIETNNLSGVHQDLPAIIVRSGALVTAIENPDDNLESLLGYLMEGRA
jgi:ABC-2 type transport system ATP-binding protein